MNHDELIDDAARRIIAGENVILQSARQAGKHQLQIDIERRVEEIRAQQNK